MSERSKPAPGWPEPDPNGPFLLVQELAEGGVSARRFSTLADAANTGVSYLGGKSRVYEVVREVDLADWLADTADR